MAIKIKELRKMTAKEREKKLHELKIELIKSKVNASDTGNSKAKEIRKAIARILTLNK
ncbi:MAG: 50S ribosomal protein L29 [Candidatus Pacearchaeota archaeon]